MGFILKLFGGSKITLALIAGAFALGSVIGGVGVYKWFRAGEVGALVAELERRDELDAERMAEAAALEDRARVLAAQLAQTRTKVRAYVPNDTSCVLPVDGVRLLNGNRPTVPPTR